MSSSVGKRKREIVALADLLTNGSNGPAVIDGDGHSIKTVKSYLDATPWFYHDEIRRLEEVCYGAESYDGTPNPRGVSSLRVHMWLATKIQVVDPMFTYRKKIGRGSQAREISKACKAFAEDHKSILVKSPWERVRDALTKRGLVNYWRGIASQGESVKARDGEEFEGDFVSPDHALP